MGKQMLWSSIGVKATYHDVGRYYLVLTDKSIYYLAFNTHHELALTDIYPLNQISNMHFRKLGIKDTMKNSEIGGTGDIKDSSEALEFTFNDETVSFTCYGQNLDFPNLEFEHYQQEFMNNTEAFQYIDVMFKPLLEEKAAIS
jgi:hypothetical protein